MADPSWATAPTLSADGTSAAILWPGGKGILTVKGTFGSGTATIKTSHDDGTTYITAVNDAGNNVAFTANGRVILELARGDKVVMVLAGATGPSLTMSAKPIGSSKA
jgi:hypothetical protein